MVKHSTPPMATAPWHPEARRTKDEGNASCQDRGTGLRSQNQNSPGGHSVDLQRQPSLNQVCQPLFRWLQPLHHSHTAIPLGVSGHVGESWLDASALPWSHALAVCGSQTSGTSIAGGSCRVQPQDAAPYPIFAWTQALNSKSPGSWHCGGAGMGVCRT